MSAWPALALALVFLYFLERYQKAFRRSLTHAPELVPLPEPAPGPWPRLLVVVPCFNEEGRIGPMLERLSANLSAPAATTRIVVVDDRSNDGSRTEAEAARDWLDDPRLEVWAGTEPPADEAWTGKAWACAQVTERLDDWDYLACLDADMQVASGFFAAALREAQRTEAGLLSVYPRVECASFGEKAVQPIMAANLVAKFPFRRVNRPTDPTAFAIGGFLLMAHDAYREVGGHRSVAGEVVDDAALARRMTAKGLPLRLALGARGIGVRMYPTLDELWEGWTKNFYVGSRRGVKGTLWFAALMVGMFSLPLALLATFPLAGWSPAPAAWGLLGVALAMQVRVWAVHRTIRRTLRMGRFPALYTLPGGVLLAAIALHSMLKSLTGWGWTWRGRPLASPAR